MESFGASCDKFPFMQGFAPNIICHYPSTSNSSELVILSAHYASRGSWGSTTAPGGDDDGSGSGHLLAVGQAIGEGGLKFDKPVILAFFAGEEQGLYGSHAFAGTSLLVLSSGPRNTHAQSTCTTRTPRCCSTSRPTCWATTR